MTKDITCVVDLMIDSVNIKERDVEVEERRKRKEIGLRGSATLLTV